MLTPESSDDPGTDLEDEVGHFSPLREPISPLPESSVDVPISLSRYLAPAVPEMSSPASATQVSPAPLRVVNSLPTIDAFPTYTISPAVSYYEPSTSPVTPALPETSDYVSPGSPTSMDNFLAGDSSLMDGTSDLPLLPLPLLPMPDHCVLPLGHVAAPSPTDAASPSVSVLADLSREGPFDVQRTVSTSGDTPLVLDSLPGCPYRMTSYDRAELADVDLAHGLQLHHPRVLEYVGAPESARFLSRSPEHWVRTMDREEAVSAALQLQHDVELMMSNLQVLGQFAMSLNHMSSEVMRLAFGQERFPSDAVQAVSPSPRICRAAYYIAAMGLWCPPGGPGAPGPVPTSTCGHCMRCTECFLDLNS